MQHRYVTFDSLVGGHAEAAGRPKRRAPVVPLQSLHGELARQRRAIGKRFGGILRRHQLRHRCKEKRGADYPKGAGQAACVEHSQPPPRTKNFTCARSTSHLNSRYLILTGGAWGVPYPPGRRICKV